MAHFTDLLDLAAERVGGVVLLANDEFFAPKDNLLKAGRGVWMPDKYTDRGKWMDGWETRRRRSPGQDWCVVRLGIPGVIRGIDVDTAHFKGNYPEYASLDACKAAPDASLEELGSASTRWVEVLPKSPLLGDTQNRFAVIDHRRWTHVRLTIYPDGGVSRLRIHGEAWPDWSKVTGPIDLAAAENGGQAVVSNDMFFGSHHNLILPGRAPNMGEGWETQRKRRPGHDWAILRLGVRGVIRRIEVDTNHFKGNCPDRCSVEVCDAEGASGDALLSPRTTWIEVLPQTKLTPHTQHLFEKELVANPPSTHVRLRIYPDGGVSRLRCHGEPLPSATWDRVDRLNRLDRDSAVSELAKCCGARRWAGRMADLRPFRDVAQILDASEKTFWEMHHSDWMEAFAAHTRIGDRAALRKKVARKEQAGVKATSARTLAGLETGNRAYERKFGFIFIVCATGKTADEMLAMLRERLGNDRDTEIANAAAEQAKITRIRLERLLTP